VLEQGAGQALAAQQAGVLADGAKEGRLAGREQASLPDVVAGHGCEWAGLDATRGVDVEDVLSGPYSSSGKWMRTMGLRRRRASTLWRKAPRASTLSTQPGRGFGP